MCSWIYSGDLAFSSSQGLGLLVFAGAQALTQKFISFGLGSPINPESKTLNRDSWG